MSYSSELVSSNQTQTSITYDCYQCDQTINPDSIIKCSDCFKAIYCSQKCQMENWPSHQTSCITEKLKNSKNYSPLGIGLFHTNAEGGSHIRGHFGDFKFPSTHDHVLQTQQFIMEGAQNLDPNKSIVVICGAQFFKGKFIEPLPALIEKCQKLILIDIDEVSLVQLKAMLNNSPKVVTIPMDLTGMEELMLSLEKEFLQTKPTKSEFFKRVIDLISNVKTNLKGFFAELENQGSVDYVISSLVASQLDPTAPIMGLYSNLFNPDPSPNDLDPELKKAYSEKMMLLQDSMRKNHLENLVSLAGPSGKVYFSDSVVHSGGKMTYEIFFNELKNYMKMNAKNVEERSWYWVRNPDSKRDSWTVNAFLMQK